MIYQGEFNGEIYGCGRFSGTCRRYVQSNLTANHICVGCQFCSIRLSEVEAEKEDIGEDRVAVGNARAEIASWRLS